MLVDFSFHANYANNYLGFRDKLNPIFIAQINYKSIK